MPVVSLSVRSNSGLVELSNACAGASFELLGGWPDGDGLRLLVRATGVTVASLVETLEDVPEVREFELRHSDDHTTLFEVNTPAPIPHGATAESGIVPSFPLRIEDGWITGELVASREQLSAFCDELRAGDIEYRVSYVSATYEAEDLLTERQREVLEAAIRNGYYDYPRGCTVTELAANLGVDKSGVSRLLQRAEGKIIDAYYSAE